VRGTDGTSIEEVGELTAEEAEQYHFARPQEEPHGTGTQLLLPLRYFVERPYFTQSKWGMYIFVTGGALDDLEEVKEYCVQLAQDIKAGKRGALKLVLIGLGSDVREEQMSELADLEAEAGVDLWDYRLAPEVEGLAEVFTEVVDEVVAMACGGAVRDESGKVVKDYRDTGLPSLLEFTLPADAVSSFTLEVGDELFIQPMPFPEAVPEKAQMCPNPKCSHNNEGKDEHK